jgi:hypothetical protein
MVQNTLTLAQLGWRPYFQQQIGLEQWENPVARVITRHRNRLELLGEAQTEPVVILSKADLCDDVESLRSKVQALDPLLMVETVNCLDAEESQRLSPWCGTGKTIARIVTKV